MDISKYHIPQLIGPNRGPWYERIQSTARIINIWDAMRGNILTLAPNLTWDLLPQPTTPPATATAAEVATYTAAKTLWDQKNSQGLGLIQATISNVIWQRYETLPTAKQILDGLKAEFGAAGGHRPTSNWSIWWKFKSPMWRICCHRSNNFRIIITW